VVVTSRRPRTGTDGPLHTTFPPSWATNGVTTTTIAAEKSVPTRYGQRRFAGARRHATRSTAAIQALRLAAVGLAFAAYALLIDLDRLLQAAGFARRSVLAAGLATRLVPTLERDASGFVEALRGRGIEVSGVHGRARLLSPLLAGSLERALNLAEAMEARGFGRAGRTRAPSPPWTRLDRAALAAAVLLVVGSLWL